MSYLIPISQLSLAEQARRREQAVRAGKQALVNAAVVRSVDAAVDRDPDYPFDFVPAATRAGLAGWLTQPLLVIGNAYSVFANNAAAALAPQVPNNSVWVFYGVHVVTALVNPVTQLVFTFGTAANRKAQFDMEKLYDKLEFSGYFTQPVVYGPQDIVGCTVRAGIATGVALILVLDTIVIEPLQVNIV